MLQVGGHSWGKGGSVEQNVCHSPLQKRNRGCMHGHGPRVHGWGQLVYRDSREPGCVACPRALVYWFTCVWRKGRAVGREVRLLIEEQLTGEARGQG